MMRIDALSPTSRFSPGATPGEAIRRTIAAFSRRSTGVFFVQVGSNDGLTGDPIYRHIVADGWAGVLVEPVTYLFHRLLATYRDRPGLRFENCAISERDGVRAFYRLRETTDPLPCWYDQIGSFYPEVLFRHRDAIPQLESRLVKESVPCLTLETLFRRHCVERLDLLHIDTEGHDFQVLAQLEFERYRPGLILFEHKHLSTRERTQALDLLQAHDYEMLADEESGDTLAAAR